MPLKRCEFGCPHGQKRAQERVTGLEPGGPQQPMAGELSRGGVRPLRPVDKPVEIGSGGEIRIKPSLV
jgi:hypothetical protein